ncbi:protein kinase [Ketobacter sp. MCCC 1A13808]|uniref:ArgK/MeaB family GTPase n=1 Tax=Ketobacter sp. MCCC 1A13808 TaxID=2602738 RepID=UPI0012EB9039|nr:GTP-binding protein [Ketobacter sp. MCCC 1A13808]MVF12489.1 protein kinase [Ketobacter sp. MCCC 1A13808]
MPPDIQYDQKPPPTSMTQPDIPPLEPWLDKLESAKALKKWPLGKLISLFESTLPESVCLRKQIIEHIDSHPQQFPKQAQVLGFTGTPGAGKSSLIAELCKQLLEQNPQLSVAVLAVDPSSQVSGGSILGDRTRMHFGKKMDRLFFRSQASNMELGGVTRATFQASRLLRHLFDYIIIETVGIGQSEIDIQFMTDHTFLVMQPLAGDQIQFMKCGIMEIPDSFIVNKCDEEKLARTSYHMLRSSLRQAKLIDLQQQDDYRQAAKDQIFLTSAVKRTGIDELVNHIQQLDTVKSVADCETFYLKKYIEKRYGEFGLSLLANDGAIQKSLLAQDLAYEQKEAYALELILKHIKY